MSGEQLFQSLPSYPRTHQWDWSRRSYCYGIVKIFKQYRNMHIYNSIWSRLIISFFCELQVLNVSEEQYYVLNWGIFIDLVGVFTEGITENLEMDGRVLWFLWAYALFWSPAVISQCFCTMRWICMLLYYILKRTQNKLDPLAEGFSHLALRILQFPIN